MASFSAQVIDASGNAKTETVDAASESEAVNILSARKLTVLEIKAGGGGGAGAAAAAGEATADAESPEKIANIKVPVVLILSFYEQLSFLVKSGIPMFLSIKMLTETVKNQNFNRVMKSVMFDLSEGFTLSSALQRFPNTFDLLHTNLIAVGERSGNLDQALENLCDLVREQKDIRDRVIKAMAYPIFLLGMSITVLLGMLLFTFPKFEEIFKAFNVKLPFMTQFFIDASHVLREKAPVVFGTGGAFTAAIIYFFRSDATSETRDRMWLALPVFRDVFSAMFTSMFTKTMYSLLRSGIPILEALTICQNTIRGKLKHDFFETVITTVRDGDKTSKGIGASPLIPDMAKQLIVIGENTGQIDQMLESIFKFYKKRYIELLGVATAIVQPVLLFFAAGLIGCVAISLFVPMFKLGQSSKANAD